MHSPLPAFAQAISLRHGRLCRWLACTFVLGLFPCLLGAELPKHLVAWGGTNYGQASFPAGVSDVVELAAGGNHTLLRTPQGAVLAWGDNTLGQTNVPSDVLGATAIAAGWEHSLALLANGTVRTWGSTNYGQNAVPAGLRAKAIAGGTYFSAAIDTDGKLVPWGYSSVSLTPGPEFTNLVMIAAGDAHVLALRADGQVLVCGGFPPLKVPPEATNVTALAAAGRHNVVLRGDGTVVAWGYNELGQTQVPPNLTNVTAIAAGGYRSAAVRGDGSVVEWGDTQSIGLKAMPGGLTNVSLLALGSSHSIALGHLRPEITTQPLSQPVDSGNPVTLEIAVSGTPPLRIQWQREGTDLPDATNSSLTLPSARTADAGAYHAIVSNKLGTATSADAVLTVIDAPPLIPSVSPAIATFRGGAVTLSVGVQGSRPMSFQWRKDSQVIPNATDIDLSLSPVAADAAGEYSVVVWNAFGTNTSVAIPVRLLPLARWGKAPLNLTEIPKAMTNAVAISARNWDVRSAVGLLANGRVTTWGNPSLFRVASNLTDVVAISTGGRGFAMALRENGSVVVWGANTARQTNIPPGLLGVVAIAAGYQHCLALRWDGAVVGWGDNTFQQASPPAGLSNVVAIGAGMIHSVALKGDGTVVAWGSDIAGQLDVPAGLDSVAAISVGADHTLGLKQDGTVVAWGRNTGGETAVPSGLTDVVAVSAGYDYSMALRRDGSLVLWGNAGAVSNLPPKLENVLALCADREIAYALLGEAPPRPFAQALSPELSDGIFAAGVATQRGVAYRLEFTGELPGRLWILGAPFPGAGRTETLIDPTATTTVRFYRIRQFR